MKVSIPKINVIMKLTKDKQNDERNSKGIEDRHSQKTNATGELTTITLVKYCGPQLSRLASSLVNVVREGGKHTKNLVSVIFFPNFSISVF